MAKIIVAITINDPNNTLRKDIDSDRVHKDGWFSQEDGDKILVDEAYIHRSKADDSFYAFEFVEVREG